MLARNLPGICSELPGICSELGVRSEFARNSLGKRPGTSHARNSPVRKSPQNMEKIARFPGGEKHAESCRVSGCHGIFRPDPREPKRQSETYVRSPRLDSLSRINTIGVCRWEEGEC